MYTTGEKLERDILYLLCRKHRHHIIEIVLSAFDIKIDIGSALGVPSFKCFQTFWPNINVEYFYNELEDIYIFQSIKYEKEKLLIFHINQLQIYQPPDDYKELLKLNITIS